ncbi:MAG TPA: sugar ABC transporter ATP-binding protein, partial [Armatimonadota bacterium]|nr:sugar ABC transporter ATP-binding protein [Armatimonadota bacterium]
MTTAPGLPTAGGSAAADGGHAPPALDAHHISKRFPGVQALTDVSLVIEPGTVHALVGENGAGKSTLVKIIAGLQSPDSGTIEVHGTRMTRFSPIAARDLGVALVAQEPEHFADLTALENLFVGRWPREAGLISWPAMERQARAMLEQMGAEIDLSARMGDLALAHRQVIQIARALLQNAKVLILDEPTAALGQEETRALFDMVRRLSGQGVAIVYISHRLEEIFEIAQQVTVLRDGRHVVTCATTQVSRDDLVRHMVGTEVAEEYSHTPADEGPGPDVPPVLALEGVTSPAGFADVSLDVRPGEVLGLAGLAGSGRNELAHALGGALPIASGRVVVNGETRRLKGPDGARRLGLVLAPGDRPGRALVLPMTVRENITLSLLRELRRGPLTNVRAESALADEYIGKLDIRTPSAEQAT